MPRIKIEIKAVFLVFYPRSEIYRLYRCHDTFGGMVLIEHIEIWSSGRSNAAMQPAFETEAYMRLKLANVCANRS